jgi:hypothetical protein
LLTSVDAFGADEACLGPHRFLQLAGFGLEPPKARPEIMSITCLSADLHRHDDLAFDNVHRLSVVALDSFIAALENLSF